VAYAEATAVELQQVSSQVASLATRKTAPVRLGITIQSRDFFIDTVVASYLKDDPSSCVQIVEDTRTVVMEQLRLGRIDVVLAPSYEVREPLLVEKSLMEIESGVLAGKHHPLGRKRNLKLKDLMHSKWILPLPDGRFYRWIAEEFRNKGLDFPLPSVQTSSLWSVKSLLKKTDLISVHGIQFMQHELSSGELQVLKGDWSFRRGTLSLFMHNRAEQSSGAVHFATLMEQHAEVLRRRS
jgi:DNA-binding transcriptional LysR family regulator